jgi:DnaJ-class molecular chaperone
MSRTVRASAAAPPAARRRRRRRGHGRDRARRRLDGVRREVEFEAVVRCEHCHGNGAEPGTPIETCATCGGAGQVRQVTRTPFGQMVRAAPCPTCGGDGKVAETPCEVCGGAGSVEDRKSYECEVPAGIENGQRIRIVAPATPAAAAGLRRPLRPGR